MTEPTLHERAQALQLRLAKIRAGIDPDSPIPFKLTHDQQLVYPAGAELPAGASGFVQCKLTEYKGPGTGSYSTSLAPEDRPLARADYERIKREAIAFRTRAQAETALRALGCEYPNKTLRGMRTQYQVRAYAKLWPLREVP